MAKKSDRKETEKKFKIFIPHDSFVRDAYVNLEEYIEESLRPSSEQLRRFHARIDTLIEYIKGTPKVNIFHVKKAGAVERGTATIYSLHADVSVFLSVKNLDELEHYLELTLDQLHARLEQHRWSEDAQMTLHARTLSTFCHEKGVHVSICDPDTGDVYTADFYPAFDVLGSAAGGDLWSHERKDRRDLYKKRVEDLRHAPSVTLLYTRIFVDLVPDDVKRLCGVVWAWRKLCFQKEKQSDRSRRLPGHLLLELLCFHAWEQAGKPRTFPMDQAFKGVLSMLTNPGAITASWTFNFDRVLVDRYFTGKLGNFSTKILVVDPVNPWYNMADSCTAWDEVAEVAKVTMTKALLTTVPLSKSWNSDIS